MHVNKSELLFHPLTSFGYCFHDSIFSGFCQASGAKTDFLCTAPDDAENVYSFRNIVLRLYEIQSKGLHFARDCDIMKNIVIEKTVCQKGDAADENLRSAYTFDLLGRH